MGKINTKEENFPKIERVKTSTYRLECPYCKKMLQSEYIKQLNANYKTHITFCKERE